MSRVTHFEIHATNPQTLVDFYSALFGWTFRQWGDEAYWQIETGAANQPGIDGGLVTRRGLPPAVAEGVNAFVCTIEVESMDQCIAKALSLGATVVLAKTSISGVGWIAYAKDPEGNNFGLMQPDPSAQ